MAEMNNKWSLMYLNFRMDFPSIENKTVDWWPISRREIMVQLDDDRKMVYDNLKSTIRRVGDNHFENEYEFRVHFSHKLEELMQANHISGKELSEHIGVTVQMVSRYLNCKSSPSIFVIRKMADLFNTSVSELIEIADVD